MEVCLRVAAARPAPDFVAGPLTTLREEIKMRRTLQNVCGFLLLGGLAAFQAPEAIAQITFNATAAAAKSTTILQSVDMTGVTSVIKFKFTAGTISTGQLFTMGFCFQDPSNTTAAPCGSSGEYVVVVPGGGSALAVVPASLLTGHILVVVNPTSTPVRYTVVME